MHELFQQLLDFAARYNFETGHETCKLVLKLIMKLILNECATAHQQQSTSHTRFNECVEYMENNVATLKSVKELAGKVNMHPSYLIRLFNQFDSESPYKRLIRLKAREAAEILMYTDKTIREVADELGFEDPFNFSKCFKRVYGVSPKHFRDNFEKK
jgi:transcriptional regulator GlxA family with amidase domain